MMKTGTKALFVGAALSALLLTGCTNTQDVAENETSDDTANEEVTRIAYLASFTNHDWAQVGIAAAQNVADEMGAEMEVFDAQSDPSKQQAQIQDIITTQQFDGIVLMPVDGVGIVPEVEEAIDAGLSVVPVAFPVGADLTTREPQVEGMAGSVVLAPSDNGKTLADMAIQVTQPRFLGPIKM